MTSTFDPNLGVYVPENTPPEAFAPDTHFETRLEAVRRERQEAQAALEAEMVAADGRGELWTARAALKPSAHGTAAFVLIHKGDTRKDEMTDEAMHSQHREAGIFMEATRFMGSKPEIMAAIAGMFTVAEYTFRFV